MTLSELRRMATPLLEQHLLAPDAIEDLEARSRRRRRRHVASAAGGGLLAVVLAVVLLATTLTTAPTTRSPGTARLASYIETGVSVPDSVLEQVGLPPGVTPPTSLQGQPPLTDGGLPAVVYVGAEFCPYCAIQRWALVVALSRFGSFSSLGQIIGSSSSDIYPNLQSWSFHGSSYTSSYITFLPAEVETSTPVSATGNSYGYTPLDKLSPLQKLAFDTYAAPPYSFVNDGIPFVDVGNSFLMNGALASPAVLENLSLDQIASDLGDPSNPVAQVVDGSANYIIASLCSIAGSPDVPICSASFVTQAQTSMTKTTN